MFAISAVDAISPAVQRTREFLFRQFTWATYLKLCLVAVITEGLGSNLRSSSHKSSPQPGPGLPSSFHLEPVWLVAIAVAALVAIALGIVVIYLVTRLRFALLHCLLRNTRQIRPGWQLYAEPALRFFWLNLAVGFCYLLLVALIAIPFAAGFWRLLHDIPPGGHPDLVALLALALPLIPIALLLLLVGILLDVILRDWMLPHYALENATAGQAWAGVWARIKSEKRQFIVYALLRLILPIVAMAALFVILILPGIMLAGSLGAIEYGLHSAFLGSTGASAVVGIVFEVFFGVLALGFAVLASIGIGGPVSIAIRNYALVFYGGRYPILGNLLYPPPPPVTSQPLPA